MRRILAGLTLAVLSIGLPLGIGLLGYWLIGQENYENLLARIAAVYALLVAALFGAGVAFAIIRAIWRKLKAKR